MQPERQRDLDKSDYYEGRRLSWLEAFGHLVVLSPVLIYELIREFVEKLGKLKKGTHVKK